MATILFLPTIDISGAYVEEKNIPELEKSEKQIMLEAQLMEQISMRDSLETKIRLSLKKM
jgi:hypothetical protein